MKFLQILKNYLKLFYIKKSKAIYTCLKNDIPLTDNNIREVEEILNYKKQAKNKTVKNNLLK